MKEVQIDYLLFLDIVILNSDFNSASSTPACTMFKCGRPAKAVWEHFVKVKSNGKTVARCKFCGHQMTPKCDKLVQVQIDYLLFLDIVILNSDFNSASSTPATMHHV